MKGIWGEDYVHILEFYRIDEWKFFFSLQENGEYSYDMQRKPIKWIINCQNKWGGFFVNENNFSFYEYIYKRQKIICNNIKYRKDNLDWLVVMVLGTL